MALEEKRWKKEFEKEIREKWEKEKIFKFNLEADKKIFSIDTPPPYPSGRPWHIGAAAHYSQIDMIARSQRLLGKEVYFPLGIDRNGLPVEIYTEKKRGISIVTTPREKFLEYCKEELDDLENYLIEIMKKLGLSCDFKNRYHTDSPEYRKITQATFIESWKKGLVYEDTRPTNYCPVCHTTIADAEVVYKEIPTKFVYLKFKVKENGKEVIVATTRPELLPSCAAVLFNPNDERYKDLEGKTLITPIGTEVKVYAHPYAKPEFGSGLVMICSYGDYSDVQIFRELKLKEKVIIDTDGKITEGKYKGLSVEEARKKIIEDLEKEGKIEKIEEIMHRTPTCERSKNPIEIIPMKEYYLKQEEFAGKIKEMQKDLKFFPEQHRQILLDWIKSIKIDWPITRRRYYGTEVPIWYCKKCGTPWLPEPGKYYQPWKENPPSGAKCEKCGSTEFVGDERTFDTWMDSSITALYVAGYLQNEKKFEKLFPISIRTQAKDIVRTWLFYSLLRSYQLTGKLPFENVWIFGYGVDKHGRKMSKSLGNVVDPLPVLEKYGGDAVRFWAASESNLGFDFRYSEEKIENAKKFLTKLWNVARFVSNFQIVEEAKPTNTDEWILSELNKTIKKCKESYENFNFFIASNEIRYFMWNIFADHYLELVKKRAYNNDRSALYTMHKCLKTIIKLISPICPYIAEKLFSSIYRKSMINEEFPELSEYGNDEYLKHTEKLMELNSKIWKYKKEKGMSLNGELKEVWIPEEFKLFEKDLKEMHKIKNLKFGEPKEIKGNIIKFEKITIVE